MLHFTGAPGRSGFWALACAGGEKKKTPRRVHANKTLFVSIVFITPVTLHAGLFFTGGPDVDFALSLYLSFICRGKAWLL